MAHHYNDNGTIYEIGGGRVNVNGTVYEIDHGKYNDNGTVYELSFGAPLISFTIKGMGMSAKTYTAEEGMTWEDFIASEYNDGNFSLNGGSSSTKDWTVYMYNSSKWALVDYGGGGTQTKTSVIRDGVTYNLS